MVVHLLAIGVMCGTTTPSKSEYKQYNLGLYRLSIKTATHRNLLIFQWLS